MHDQYNASGIPKYLVIAEDLHKKIQDGIYAPDSFLSPEFELQKIYRVSRPTIRAAIARLRDQNLVKVLHGIGTRVVNHSLTMRLDNLLSFTDVIRTEGMVPGIKVVRLDYGKATPEVAASLGIQRHSRIFQVGRLFTADGEIISYHLSYLKEEYLIKQEKLEQSLSLYRCLEDIYGVQIIYTDDTIYAEPASAANAKLLGIKKGKPLLVLTRKAFTYENQVVEYAVSFIRNDRLKYKARIYRKGRFQ